MQVELEEVEVLVAAASAGDEAAWNAIVDRYAALVWSVCRSFRLGDADAADVSQTVWLRAVERLPTLREPAALPGWLATTTRRECIKVSSSRSKAPRSLDVMVLEPAADEERTAPDADLLAAERRATVREAFARLPEHCQRLLALLVAPDRRPYAEIGARLGMPVGSIGPTRSRCLDKLRDCPPLAQWAAADGVREPEGGRRG